MFDNMENIKLISYSKGTASQSSKVENRKTHLFLFRTSGTTCLTAEGESYVLNSGEMLYIPKGLSYESGKISEEDCEYTAVVFDADIEITKPKKYLTKDIPEGEFICSHLPDMWKLGTTADKLKCISMFYGILSHISNIENSAYSEKSKFEIIEPAIKYLNKNIFKTTFKVDSLPAICGISDTYFRKIFIAKYGTTPQKYVVSKRLSHARTIIDIGHIKSVSKLALTVGYKDPLYFSKAFKKKYGISPSEAN